MSRKESPGRLDTRYQGPDYDPLSEEAHYDPQSNAISSAYTTAINQYMREDLKFGDNWTYKPSAYGEPGFRWQMRYAEGGQNVMPDLARKLKANPKTKCCWPAATTISRRRSSKGCTRCTTCRFRRPAGQHQLQVLPGRDT
jgi:hypothetical protein